MPRRPVPRSRAGVVACLAGTALLASACGGPPPINSPVLAGEAARVCGALVDTLPETVDGASRREVDSDAVYAAAWGDPAIVLRCGVAMPPEFDEFSTCQVTQDVGWFVPEEQITGRPTEITMTTVGRTQNVEVVLPAEHFPPANAMVDLADAIKQTVPEVKPCV